MMEEVWATLSSSICCQRRNVVLSSSTSSAALVTFVAMLDSLTNSSVTGVRRPGKGQAGMFEVVNVIASELDAGQLKETGPPDALDPLSQTLVFAGVLGVNVHNVGDRVHHFGPARRIVGQERNRQLRKLRRAAGVAYFAANPDRQAIVLGIGQGHGWADGIDRKST